LIFSFFFLSIPIVLVGNKIDRKDERVVSTEEGRSLANSWKVPFVEISAMDIKVKYFQKKEFLFENFF
jgi:GTPase SAR1 family protein